MALVTYPLNNVDYQAEDAELFHCPRESGIYAGDDFSCTVTGADNTVTIDVGLCWIRNSRFSGKVAALKAAVSLDMGVSDSTYPRIDAVVLQFDANKNSTAVVVKQGAAASAPVAPAVSRTEALYELHLYHVRREAGATVVTAADITDLRLDSNYCGLMADSVTRVDTSQISAQISALITQLREELAAVKDGSAYVLRNDVQDIEHGGTGAANALNALINLGLTDSELIDIEADDAASWETKIKQYIVEKIPDRRLFVFNAGWKGRAYGTAIAWHTLNEIFVIICNTAGTGGMKFWRYVEDAQEWNDVPLILSPDQYGDTLPEPGIPGRIFFLKA